MGGRMLQTEELIKRGGTEEWNLVGGPVTPADRLLLHLFRTKASVGASGFLLFRSTGPQLGGVTARFTAEFLGNRNSVTVLVDVEQK